jgi:hypothetical protein
MAHAQIPQKSHRKFLQSRDVFSWRTRHSARQRGDERDSSIIAGMNL